MKDLLAQRPVSRNLLGLLMVTLSFAVVPHGWNLQPAIPAGFVLFIVLRTLFWKEPETVPPRWLMVLLVLGGLALVLLQAGFTEGRQFGVALLVIMAGLKLLELKTHRDLYVSAFLGYFLLITLFLYQQSPALTFYVLLLTTSFTAILIAANRVNPNPPLKPVLGSAALLVATAIPVMILLFLLFPRLEGPLWQLNLGGGRGITGMSDNISMGSISQLSLSDKVAFRVRFTGEPPPPDRRYWRGMVLWRTDGRNWSRAPVEQGPVGWRAAGKTLDYEITMEPSNQPWLFPLDRIVTQPDDLALNRLGELESNASIQRRFSFRAVSAALIDGEELDSRDRQLGLQLPDQLSARTRGLAAVWRQQAGNDAEVIHLALAHFNRQPFIYTLMPPRLGDDPLDEFLFDTRQGFCEHYATSFVVLMRLAGIPARVVIGYQGGDLNPLGGHLTVRQADAHAWAEVWLEGKGWTRIDPTAAVAPERIQQPIFNVARRTGEPVMFLLDASGFLGRLGRQMGWLKDNLELQWHYWVVNFNRSRQHSLLEGMGLPNLQTWHMGVAAVIGALVLGGLLFYFSQRQRARRDPIQREWLRFRRKLERSGLQLPPSLGPEDLGRLARSHYPHRAKEIQAIVGQYIALRYGRRPRTDIIGHYRRRIRQLRL